MKGFLLKYSLLACATGLGILVVVNLQSSGALFSMLPFANNATTAANSCDPTSCMQACARAWIACPRCSGGSVTCTEQRRNCALEKNACEADCSAGCEESSSSIDGQQSSLQTFPPRSVPSAIPTPTPIPSQVSSANFQAPSPSTCTAQGNGTTACSDCLQNACVSRNNADAMAFCRQQCAPDTGGFTPPIDQGPTTAQVNQEACRNQGNGTANCSHCLSLTCTPGRTAQDAAALCRDACVRNTDVNISACKAQTTGTFDCTTCLDYACRFGQNNATALTTCAASCNPARTEASIIACREQGLQTPNCLHCLGQLCKLDTNRDNALQSCAEHCIDRSLFAECITPPPSVTAQRSSCTACLRTSCLRDPTPTRAQQVCAAECGLPRQETSHTERVLACLNQTDTTYECGTCLYNLCEVASSEEAFNGCLLQGQCTRVCESDTGNSNCDRCRIQACRSELGDAETETFCAGACRNIGTLAPGETSSAAAPSSAAVASIPSSGDSCMALRNGTEACDTCVERICTLYANNNIADFHGRHTASVVCREACGLGPARPASSPSAPPPPVAPTPPPATSSSLSLPPPVTPPPASSFSSTSQPIISSSSRSSLAADCDLSGCMLVCIAANRACRAQCTNGATTICYDHLQSCRQQNIACENRCTAICQATLPPPAPTPVPTTPDPPSVSPSSPASTASPASSSASSCPNCVSVLLQCRRACTGGTATCEYEYYRCERNFQACQDSRRGGSC